LLSQPLDQRQARVWGRVRVSVRVRVRVSVRVRVRVRVRIYSANVPSKTRPRRVISAALSATFSG